MNLKQQFRRQSLIEDITSDLTQLYLQKVESQKQQIILDLAASELEDSVDPMIVERNC